MIVNRGALPGLPHHGRYDETLLGVAIQQVPRISFIGGLERLGREERILAQQAFESRFGGADEVPPMRAVIVNVRKLLREAGDGGCDCVHGGLLIARIGVTPSLSIR